jgi:hypothetical protein|tara:strand:+ start:380 stop:490 length:111 start_codon:yes stop_codon:yes gene_type:complete
MPRVHALSQYLNQTALRMRIVAQEKDAEVESVLREQ